MQHYSKLSPHVITHFNSDGNQIKSIEDITKLVTLQELYLRENPIDHLDEIKKLP